MRLKLFVIFSDFIFILITYVLVVLYAYTLNDLLNETNLVSISVFLSTWMILSLLLKKFQLKDNYSLRKNIFNVIKANLIILLTISAAFYFFDIAFSKSLILITVGIITLFEVVASSFFILTVKITPCIDQETISTELIPQSDASQDDWSYTLPRDLEKKIEVYTSRKSREFIFKHIRHSELNKTLYIATITKFNIEHQNIDFQIIVNFKRINNCKRINKFFEAVNRKLPIGGLYISKVETYTLRKERILKKFPFGINYVYYCLDFVFKRVFPKLFLTKWLYFFITRGNNRILSKAETLGRLYSCGFEIDSEELIDNHLYFVARKTKDPSYDMNPTYGPFVKLRRVGKNFKVFNVYKLRTMHPYSEYIQEYLFQNNGSDTGDKINNDFRVTTLGRFFRKFWLDELPMFINLIKGDIKLVGVRPLSKHKFSIYPEKVQKLRTLTKPGLIPPYYVDLPDNFDGLVASEVNYLNKYLDNPLKTDIEYFFKAFYNIVIKKARSQ